jgi:hypothetical protein
MVEGWIVEHHVREVADAAERELQIRDMPRLPEEHALSVIELEWIAQRAPASQQEGNDPAQKGGPEHEQISEEYFARQL